MDIDSSVKFYDIEGFGQYGILVPVSVSPELAVKILASILSYKQGFKGVDYPLKIYGKKFRENIEKQYSGGVEFVGETIVGKELKTWGNLSKEGMVCGFYRCQEKPVVKCEHCLNVYCIEHSVVIGWRSHKLVE
jgi:hypothetical protein